MKLKEFVSLTFLSFKLSHIIFVTLPTLNNRFLIII